jgi:hypothetical protein
MRVPDRKEYHRNKVGLFIRNAGDIIASHLRREP